MLLDLWVYKTRGEDKGFHTFWKTIRSDFVPDNGRILTFRTKSDNVTHYRISDIQYEYDKRKLRIALFLKKIR